MKILKEGTLPEEKIYVGICNNCKCMIQFTRHEAKISSHRNETYLTVKCPTPKCEHSITVEVEY